MGCTIDTAEGPQSQSSKQYGAGGARSKRKVWTVAAPRREESSWKDSIDEGVRDGSGSGAGIGSGGCALSVVALDHVNFR
jgi:hypothetical protein